MQVGTVLDVRIAAAHQQGQQITTSSVLVPDPEEVGERLEWGLRLGLGPAADGKLLCLLQGVPHHHLLSFSLRGGGGQVLQQQQRQHTIKKTVSQSYEGEKTPLCGLKQASESIHLEHIVLKNKDAMIVLQGGSGQVLQQENRTMKAGMKSLRQKSTRNHHVLHTLQNTKHWE